MSICKECWLGSCFVIVQGIRTSIAKKTYMFVIFQRGGGPDSKLPPTGSAHVNLSFWKKLNINLLQNNAPSLSYVIDEIASHEE